MVGPSFRKARMEIRQGNVVEGDSAEHILLQRLDVALRHLVQVSSAHLTPLDSVFHASAANMARILCSSGRRYLSITDAHGQRIDIAEVVVDQDIAKAADLAPGYLRVCSLLSSGSIWVASESVCTLHSAASYSTSSCVRSPRV
jgi:hypothetical protein